MNAGPRDPRDAPDPPERLDEVAVEVPVWRWARGEPEPGYREDRDRLAEEVPLAILYDGEPYAVMLGTPRDLHDFATGFSITEGIVHAPSALVSFEQLAQPEGIELRLGLDPSGSERGTRRERSLAGRTGCGLCGVRALASAVRFPQHVPDDLRLTAAGVDAALGRLAAGQRLHGVTGSVHAAAWFSAAGECLFVREDVGRHNALDKLLGAVLRAGIAPCNGYVVVSSRASYEMVQKAAHCGVQVIVAVSAPTAMALRVAQSCGVTLVAFARGGRHTVYSHPHRLSAGATGTAVPAAPGDAS